MRLIAFTLPAADRAASDAGRGAVSRLRGPAAPRGGEPWRRSAAHMIHAELRGALPPVHTPPAEAPLPAPIDQVRRSLLSSIIGTDMTAISVRKKKESV